MIVRFWTRRRETLFLSLSCNPLIQLCDVEWSMCAISRKDFKLCWTSATVIFAPDLINLHDHDDTHHRNFLEWKVNKNIKGSKNFNGVWWDKNQHQHTGNECFLRQDRNVLRQHSASTLMHDASKNCKNKNFQLISHSAIVNAAML